MGRFFRKTASIPGLQLHEPEDLKSWRIWFIKILIILGTILIPIGTAASLPIYLSEGNYLLIVFDLIAWIILASRLFSKGNNFALSTYIIFSLLYPMITYSFIDLGPQYARPAWLVLCSVLAALMFGIRGAAAATVLNSAILLILYLFIGPENKAWATVHEESYSKWLMFVVNLSTVTLISSLPVGFLVRKFDRSLLYEREARWKLSQETEKLRSVNLDLQNEIRQRREAVEALRQSEELYHALVETTDTGFVVIDAQGKVIDSNQEYVRLSGHQRIDDIRGRSVVEWTADYEKDRNAAAVRRCLQDGLFRNLEIDYVAADGQVIPVEINATVIEKDGAPYILTLCRDITERRQAEKEKAHLENQLAQSQKMEAIGTLAGGIAHDFNNILTPLLGYTELAQAEAGKETALEKILGEVLRAGERAKDLVKQILTFSRNTEHALKPIQVKNVINEVLKLIRSSLPSTIEIRKHIVSDAIILADPVQIHQIMMNLCTNAEHAMKNGGTLTIDLTNVEVSAGSRKEYPEANPGHYIKVSVGDTGQGMDPNILDRIFDPYFTTRTKSEGTGLGLAIVHGIVKNYNGAITVESERGKGSTFHIVLPVMKGAPRSHRESDQPLPTGYEHILFVDDEHAIAQLGVQMLERLGYHVTAITSSTEALALFKGQPEQFDLIITDMTMPGMTGEVLAVEIMRIRPDIPIVLCTGFHQQMNEKKALQLGVKAYLSKPFVVRTLAHTIREALGKQ